MAAAIPTELLANLTLRELRGRYKRSVLGWGWSIINPIFNLISEHDLGRALALAARSDAEGVFTIPGATTLPLKEIIRRSARIDVPVPGPLMTPLYGLRRAVRGTSFDYRLNRGRLHFGVVLDGQRAKRLLGYAPEVTVTFPKD